MEDRLKAICEIKDDLDCISFVSDMIDNPEDRSDEECRRLFMILCNNKPLNRILRMDIRVRADDILVGLEDKINKIKTEREEQLHLPF